MSERNYSRSSIAAPAPFVKKKRGPPLKFLSSLVPGVKCPRCSKKIINAQAVYPVWVTSCSDLHPVIIVRKKTGEIAIKISRVNPGKTELIAASSPETQRLRKALPWLKCPWCTGVLWDKEDNEYSESPTGWRGEIENYQQKWPAKCCHLHFCLVFLNLLSGEVTIRVPPTEVPSEPRGV